MLTQTKLNSILERTDILLKFYNSYVESCIALDVRDFFHRLTSTEKTTKIPTPTEVSYCPYKKVLCLEWYKVGSSKKFDYLCLEFEGDQKVKLLADYESLQIDIVQNIPFGDDFPELILAHLKLFKSSIKKKRYK